MTKINVPFMMVLTVVWLILLALCALIGILIVPVGPDVSSKALQFVISAGKVGISLFVVGLWLLAWYKSMDFLLKIELYIGESSLSE